MRQVIIDLGKVDLFGNSIGIRLYGYGLMLVLGFLTGIYLARWRARRFGESGDVVSTLGLLALIGGVVGARAAYVIEQWDSFARSDSPLLAILNITSGGLIYYGGVALAMVLAVGYLWVKRLPVRRYLDIIAPSLMIGLAFGRMGCLVNGCCFGGPCNEHFPLAMKFPYASKPLVMLDDGANHFGASSVSPAFAHQVDTPLAKGGMDVEQLPKWLFRHDEEGKVVFSAKTGRPVLRSPAELTDEQAEAAAALRARPLQPAQAYGIVNALLIAALLLRFTRLRWREGQVFLLMLILYPITRFVLESIRGDNPHNLLSLQLTHNQYVSVGMVIVALILWRGLRWLDAAAGPAWAQRLAMAAAGKSNPSNTKKRRGA